MFNNKLKTGLVLLSKHNCIGCARIKYFLDELKVPYTVLEETNGEMVPKLILGTKVLSSPITFLDIKKFLGN